jgi:hypothetical protein
VGEEGGEDALELGEWCELGEAICRVGSRDADFDVLADVLFDVSFANLDLDRG